jgi:hypothetical protein
LLAIIFSLLDLLFGLAMLGRGMAVATQTGLIDLAVISAAWRVGANMFVVVVLFARRRHFG